MFCFINDGKFDCNNVVIVDSVEKFVNKIGEALYKL